MNKTGKFKAKGYDWYCKKCYQSYPTKIEMQQCKCQGSETKQ